MTSNIEARKVELIAFIASLKKEESISAFEEFAMQFKSKKNRKNNSSISDSDLKHFKRPIRESISIEEIVAEENWKPIDVVEFYKTIDRMDIQEPIELLMSQLSA